MKTLNLIASTLLLSILFYSCNKNEYAPVITDQEFIIEENSPEGTIIGIVEASDRDESQILAYEIVDGNDQGIFQLDPSNGAIRVKEVSKLDYESIPEVVLTVAVSDEHDKDPLESSAKIRIIVMDLNEYAPVIEAQTFTLDENPLSGQEIGQVVANDAESHQQLTYRISEESSNFQIDSLSGLLSVLDSASFDFELNPSLTVTIRVNDNHENSLSAETEITIQLTNVIEVSHYAVVLQPDGENGMDALFGKIVPDTNYGLSENIHLYAWTQSGILNVNRAVIDFDLSQIPEEATIDSARFSIYFNSTSAYGDQHEGETDFVIQRITSEWTESSVTWRTQPSTSTDNQVFVDGAVLPTQDFIDIDLTRLISDYIQNKDNSHGLLLKLQEEAPFKKLLLASSEHPIEQLRPKLEIHYTLIQ